LGAKVQNIFEKQVYLIQNNIIILVFFATLRQFGFSLIWRQATKRQKAKSNVQMFKCSK
jgi:hypothetical protein